MAYLDRDAIDVAILYKTEDTLRLQTAIKLVCGFAFSDELSKSGINLAMKILEMTDCSHIMDVDQCFSRNEILEILMDIGDGK